MSADTKIDALINVLTEGMTEEDAALALMSVDVSVSIASKRIDMGLTQKEFSEYMGVSQAMVSKWEGGEANFTLKTLAQIAAKLGIKVRSPFVVDKVPAHISRFSNVVQLPNAESWEFSSSGSTFTDVGELKEM